MSSTFYTTDDHTKLVEIIKASSPDAKIKLLVGLFDETGRLVCRVSASDAALILGGKVFWDGAVVAEVIEPSIPTSEPLGPEDAARMKAAWADTVGVLRPIRSSPALGAPCGPGHLGPIGTTDGDVYAGMSLDSQKRGEGWLT